MTLAQALAQAIESLRFAEMAVRDYRGYPSSALHQQRIDEVTEARRVLSDLLRLTTGKAGARSRRDVSTGVPG